MGYFLLVIVLFNGNVNHGPRFNYEGDCMSMAISVYSSSQNISGVFCQPMNNPERMQYIDPFGKLK